LLQAAANVLGEIDTIASDTRIDERLLYGGA